MFAKEETMAHTVTAQHDAENEIYFVSESDIKGLHVEAHSLDEFVEIALDLAPDLLPSEPVIDIEFLIAACPAWPSPRNGQKPIPQA
jgi:hypothetical protein